MIVYFTIWLALILPTAALAGFSTADLTGIWHLFVFFDNPTTDDPGWSRGTVTLNSSGVATSGIFTYNNGSSASLTSGLLTINRLGFLSGSFSLSNGLTSTISHGKMDQGKSLATLVGINSQGYRFKVSAIKAGGSFATADLGGTWNYYNFVGVPGGDTALWSRGSITFNSSGVITGGSFTNSSSAGANTVTGGSFTINSSGVFSGTINFQSGLVVTLSQGKMDSNKASAAYAGVDNGFNAFSGFGVKSSGTFSTADLAGRWQYHSFGDDPTSNDPGWDHGTVIVNSSGTVTGGSSVDSDGGAATVTGGSFTINSSGIYSGSITFNNGVTTAIGQGKMGGSKTSATFVASNSHGFVFQGTALKIGGGLNDFDDDGNTDIAVYRNGLWIYNPSSDGANVATQFGGGTDVPVPADYDGDGKTDIAVYRSGLWIYQPSSGGANVAVQFGGGTDVPVPADYDGDGKTDIAVYRNGLWIYSPSSGGANVAVQFGGGTDVPVPADYDGDGKTDVAVYRSGLWIYSPSSGGANVAVQFGGGTDVPVPADYDGDGKTDVAVYRNGLWIYSPSSGGANVAVQFGGGTDIPVPADYDGEGKTDIAVYRNGLWIILRSSDGGVTATQFGGGTDVPLN